MSMSTKNANARGRTSPTKGRPTKDNGMNSSNLNASQ